MIVGSATSAARRSILQRSSCVLWMLFAMCLSTAAFAQSFGPLSGYRQVDYPGGEFPANPGAIVRELGDLDGDGYTDFAIGAPRATYRGRMNVGKTYVIYGSSEPSGFPLRSLEPDQGGDGTRGFLIGNPFASLFIQAASRLGWIGPLGDIDGDGYDDFGLSHPFQGVDFNPPPPPSNSAALTDTGALYIFYGDPRTATSVPFPAEVDLREVPNGAYGDRVVRHHPGGGVMAYGGSINRLGDFNADGFDDFAIGGRDPLRAIGVVNIYFGRGTRGVGEPDVVVLPPSTTGDGSGFESVIGGRDYNGDGVPDLQVCSRLSVLAPSGFSCYVIFGGNVAALGSAFYVGRLRASQGGDGSLGFAVDGGQNYGIGFNDAILAETDLNHDGITDLVYGSPAIEPVGGSSNDDFGRVSVLYGRRSPAFAEFDLASLDPARGGDGSNGFVLDGPPTIPRAELGYNLARAGDVNNDGVDDLLIGTGLSFNDGGVRGRAYVVFGRNAAAGQTFPARTVLDASALTNGFATSIDRTGNFPQRIDSIGAVADLNGDGRDEVLLGASGAVVNGLRYGMGTLFVSIPPQGGPGPAIAVPAFDRHLALLLALLILVIGAVSRSLARSKDA